MTATTLTLADAGTACPAYLPAHYSAQDYWYLAGPMSGIPEFNKPEFDRVAGNLRAEGYVICSPPELDTPDVVNNPGRWQHGTVGWQELLKRDLDIVTSPMCEGVIVIEGWTRSKGALLETYVADKFDKPIKKYEDNWDHGFTLTPVVREWVRG